MPNSGAGRRLFVSLVPDSSVITALTTYRHGWAWPPKCGLTPAANLHLTIGFLGDVEEQQEVALRAALSAVRVPAFELRFTTPDVWLGARVAVLKPDPHSGLAQLRADIVTAASFAGNQLDPRPLNPHVTLAKRADGAVPPNAPAAITWPISSFVLLGSRLAPTFDYQVLESWPATLA